MSNCVIQKVISSFFTCMPLFLLLFILLILLVLLMLLVLLFLFLFLILLWLLAGFRVCFFSVRLIVGLVGTRNIKV